eukprot:g26485.t1
MFVTLALPQRSALPSSTWCASHGDAKGSTLPWQLWALCLAKPGFRRIRALTRRQGYAAGEVIEVPPLTTEDEAIVVWLHGFGDTGQRWAGCVPALQQMGLPMLRFLFPTAPLTGPARGERKLLVAKSHHQAQSKELRTSWFDLSTLDLTERRRQTPEQLLEGVDYVLHLVEPHALLGKLRNIMPKRDGLSLSKREAQLVSNSADNQPSWARSLLRQDTKEEDEELEDDPATRLNSFSVRSKADLLHLVHGGDGCGVLVDDALCASYAGAAEDVKQLISSKAVRSVRPQREEKLRRRKSAEVGLRPCVMLISARAISRCCRRTRILSGKCFSLALSQRWRP